MMNNDVKRWLLILAVALLAVSVACSGSSTPVGESQSGSNVNEGEVLVEAKEFSFSLSATEAAAGTVTFVVENSGNMPHDFAIRGNGIEEATPHIDPGESATLTVELEPGTYTYICTIPGHEQLGMRGTFTVPPS
jgi:uncharacterized cupredoxin-like copper-binding protein